MLSRFFILFTLLLIAGCGPCPPLSLPEIFQEPEIKISDAAGRGHSLNDLMQAQWSDRMASLFFFVLSDCPISNAYAPEIERITRECAQRGVRVFVVFCDPDLTASSVRDHMNDYGLSAEALLDERLDLARRVGATIAPEAALVSRGAVHYLGRIDDKYAALGVNREVVTQRNLRDALDAFLDGRPIAQPRVAAVGCYISRD